MKLRIFLPKYFAMFGTSILSVFLSVSPVYAVDESAVYLLHGNSRKWVPLEPQSRTLELDKHHLQLPTLISGPYNFDPSFNQDESSQNQKFNHTSESLEWLGKTPIHTQIKLKPSTFSLIKANQVSPGYGLQNLGINKIPQLNLTDFSRNNRHLLKRRQQEEKKLNRIARKQIEQEEQKKINHLKQLETYFETQEKQERKRLKQLERNRIRAEKEKIQKRIKEEKQEEKAKKLAAKERKKQEKLAEQKNEKPLITPISFETNINRVTNKSGDLNQISEGTARFKLFNGDKLSVTSGLNIFDQTRIQRIYNLPLKIMWERKIGDYTLSTKAGIDWYDRLELVPSISLGLSRPISLPKGWAKVLTVSTEIDYGPYKFNAQTIENSIRYLRLKGNVFWQIKDNTSFFASGYIGALSDKNREYQVFSRLEYKMGQNFSLSGNLFAWGFKNDVSTTSGYFSPPDFLVYNGELAWQDNITSFLGCQASASIGRQRSQGKWNNASTFKAICTADITRNIAIDFGYTFSNSFAGSNVTNNPFFSNTFSSNVRVKF